MKIAIASDHGGYELKEKIKRHLSSKGADVVDFGTDSGAAVDYPDYAKKVARSVLSKKADCGILVCGSGIGMSITANRFKGIRAAVCESLYTAQMAKKHGNVNILCLGGRILPVKKALKMVDLWLNTEFEPDARHIRRLKKIDR